MDPSLPGCFSAKVKNIRASSDLQGNGKSIAGKARSYAQRRGQLAVNFNVATTPRSWPGRTPTCQP